MVRGVVLVSLRTPRGNRARLSDVLVNSQNRELLRRGVVRDRAARAQRHLALVKFTRGLGAAALVAQAIATDSTQARLTQPCLTQLRSTRPCPTQSRSVLPGSVVWERCLQQCCLERMPFAAVAFVDVSVDAAFNLHEFVHSVRHLLDRSTCI
jgi:hypothetical protein